MQLVKSAVLELLPEEMWIPGTDPTPEDIAYIVSRRVLDDGRPASHEANHHFTAWMLCILARELGFEYAYFYLPGQVPLL